MRKCAFWSFAAFSAGGISVMALMGRNGTDGVHTHDVILVMILAAVVVATWLVVDRLDRNADLVRQSEQDRADREADRELLVVRTIRQTLLATGHPLDREDAKVYQIKG